MVGNGKGIQKIQTYYEIATKKQIWARHTAIMQSFLRWPTVVTTLLVAVLITYLTFLLPAKPLKLMVVFFVASPALIMVAASIPYYWRKDSRKKLVWNYVFSFGGVSNGILNGFNLLRTNTELPSSQFWLVGILLLSMVCLYLAFSLAQLTREHFYYKIA